MIRWLPETHAVLLRAAVGGFRGVWPGARSPAGGALDGGKRRSHLCCDFQSLMSGTQGAGHGVKLTLPLYLSLSRSLLLFFSTPLCAPLSAHPSLSFSLFFISR